MSSTSRSKSGPLTALISSLTALALASGAIYALGPWSAAEPSVAVEPRPTGTPVKVSGRTVSVLAAGDVLAHPELWDQARRDGGGQLDFTPMLAPARQTISSADLALCHLEVPLAPPGGPYTGFPKFSVPREIARGITSVGYDGCSTASNHSIDQGYDGITRTLAALDEAGLGHTGTYRTQRESRMPRIYRVHGVNIGHLSYTKGLNGLKPPAGKEWMAKLIDVGAIRRDAAAARQAGAEIVLISLHWGTEYEHEPDADQQTWARKIARIEDVDVVFGHHAHVVQPVERINGTWVVYGMGNQLARHAEPVNVNRDGTMIRVTFSPTGKHGRWRAAAIEAIPTFVDLNPDIRLVDLEERLADPDLSPGRRRIYEAAVERIEGNLLTRAAATAGLIVRGR